MRAARETGTVKREDGVSNDWQRTISVYQLGLSNYADAHRLQQRLQAQRREGSGVDTLLLTEHRPVITLGRGHPEPDLKVAPAVVKNQGIAIVPTERGGNITYHGPGQLVAYGIVDLKGWDCSVIDFVHGLEETAISVLGDWGIRGERADRARGVWVQGRKIASVGLHVRRWVTMHGIALNVDPDMSHFDLINPCGMDDVEMTSLAAEASKGIAMTEVVESFTDHFGRVFDCEIRLEEVPRRVAGRS
jgi:lipoate-protein ligase B